MLKFTNSSVEQEVEAYTKTVESAKARLINNLAAMKDSVVSRLFKTDSAMNDLRAELITLNNDKRKIETALYNVQETK